MQTRGGKYNFWVRAQISPSPRRKPATNHPINRRTNHQPTLGATKVVYLSEKSKFFLSSILFTIPNPHVYRTPTSKSNL